MDVGNTKTIFYRLVEKGSEFRVCDTRTIEGYNLAAEQQCVPSFVRGLSLKTFHPFSAKVDNITF
ncbi:hypothetical protein D3C71_2079170 [compost metagenome]